MIQEMYTMKSLKKSRHKKTALISRIVGCYHDEYLFNIKRLLIDCYLSKDKEALLEEFERFINYMKNNPAYTNITVDVLREFTIYMFHMGLYKEVLNAFELLVKISNQEKIYNEKVLDRISCSNDINEKVRRIYRIVACS